MTQTGDVRMEATRVTYGKTLVRLGETNKNIVVMDADLSGSTNTKRFGDAYPDRFFNAGIAEQNMISIASGLAMAGKTVFASTFAAFATGRPYDQIRIMVALSNANVKIAASHAGLTVGEDGASHQMIEDIALMRNLPNMRVAVPADCIETSPVSRGWSV